MTSLGWLEDRIMAGTGGPAQPVSQPAGFPLLERRFGYVAKSTTNGAAANTLTRSATNKVSIFF